MTGPSGQVEPVSPVIHLGRYASARGRRSVVRPLAA